MAHTEDRRGKEALTWMHICSFVSIYGVINLQGGSVFQLLALDRFGLRAHLCPTALDSNQSPERWIIYHSHSTVNEKLFFWSGEKQFAQRGCGYSRAIWTQPCALG